MFSTGILGRLRRPLKTAQVFLDLKRNEVERVRGVEPLSSAWKAEVMPLYDTRALFFIRGAGIRTRTKSSQKTRATIALRPVNQLNFSRFQRNYQQLLTVVLCYNEMVIKLYL